MADEERDDELEQDDEDSGEEQEEEGEEQEGGEQKKPYSDEAIPKELRGLPPDQIARTWDLMTRTIEEQGNQLKELRSKPATREAPPEDDEEITSEKLKDLIIEDPEKAIKYVTRKAFGQAFAGASSNAESAVFLDARSRYPDFTKHEEKVKNLLKQGNVVVNEESVRGAYLMALGEATLETKRSKPSVPPSERPTPRSKGGKKERNFENETQREIWQKSGLSKDEYFDLMEQDTVEVDVPLGVGGKK